ncbi:MAG: TIGR00730 family Rossman fold protein [Candidatus Obscuribacterales bacterium]|nr:TIGR00730 family Rossman fold protein [Candidatus Obscuribacterales bacterium]
MKQLNRVAVYCGAATGRSPAYRAGAVALGHELANQGIQLVYGGGNVGLMGVVANAVLEKGGHVIGVIPQDLMNKELGHTGIQDLRVVDTMHQRKAMMSELSDAFITMPGGYGTLEELFEMITWLKLGVHSKPCSLYNVDSYYQQLVDFLHHVSTEGFMTVEDRALLIIENEPVALLDKLRAFNPTTSTQWLSLEKT